MSWDAATKYRLLLQINNAMVNETTRSGLFRALADEIRKSLTFDRFSINLYDDKNQSLSYFATADGISPAGIGDDERPVTKGAIASAVIRSRRPLIITDLSSHIYWESVRALKDAGLNATMAFPLIVRDAVLGTLHFSFTRAPDNTDEVVDFLTELSGQVALAVDHMLARTRIRAVNEHLRRQKDFLLSQDESRSGLHDIFYAGAAMREVMRLAALFADADVSVLITGETGTGKDLVARYTHNLSPRRSGLFVKVNCPALIPGLFESELFGHAKGAFTGAEAKRIGRFEMADGGTVFLDEIGDLDISLQAKLLHVIQDRVFERVGESRPVETDFRLISATNTDLKQSIQAKTFRSDLFFRLNTVSIHVPPLRERIDDIPVLVERLAAIQALKTRFQAPRFSDSCLKAMIRYPWPGNVRELKNLVQRLVIMRPGDLITARDIAAFIGDAPELPRQEHMTLAEMEKRHIQRTLVKTGGVVGGPKGAAALLGLPRQTLQYRMRKHGLTARSLG